MKNIIKRIDYAIGLFLVVFVLFALIYFSPVRTFINHHYAETKECTVDSADAMRSAAENPNGAFMGYMGMGMAQQAGGVDTKALYEMGQKQQVQEARSHQESSQAAARSWTCPDCQTSNTGNFCSNCGKEKPAVSAAKFCSNCGWQVPDPSNPPKFCPECGTAF